MTSVDGRLPPCQAKTNSSIAATTRPGGPDEETPKIAAASSAAPARWENMSGSMGSSECVFAFLRQRLMGFLPGSARHDGGDGSLQRRNHAAASQSRCRGEPLYQLPGLCRHATSPAYRVEMCGISPSVPCLEIHR